jgi:hypothetical protein
MNLTNPRARQSISNNTPQTGNTPALNPPVLLRAGIITTFALSPTCDPGAALPVNAHAAVQQPWAYMHTACDRSAVGIHLLCVCIFESHQCASACGDARLQEKCASPCEQLHAARNTQPRNAYHCKGHDIIAPPSTRAATPPSFHQRLLDDQAHDRAAIAAALGCARDCKACLQRGGGKGRGRGQWHILAVRNEWNGALELGHL